jgi:hypothetical protein
MKYVAWLLLFVACAGSPAPSTPTVTMAPDCPSCPTCETQVCPTCPKCPDPVKRPEPVARDWHCMKLSPPNEAPATFCWQSSHVCESYRQKVLSDIKQYGKASTCTAHPVAFCFVIRDPNSMSRQMRCLSTLEDCELHRQEHIDFPVTKTAQTSTCQSTLNTDELSHDVGNDLNPLP